MKWFAITMYNCLPRSLLVWGFWQYHIRVIIINGLFWGIEIQYEICILCIATGKMDALTPKSWVKGHGDIIPHALSGEHVDNLWTLTWAKNGRPREEIRFISILGRDRNENLLMIFFLSLVQGFKPYHPTSHLRLMAFSSCNLKPFSLDLSASGLFGLCVNLSTSGSL